MVENDKAYEAGKKLAEKQNEVTVRNLDRFISHIEKISAKGGKIDWDNGNPFTRDLKDIYENLHDAEAKLEARKQKTGLNWGDDFSSYRDGFYENRDYISATYKDFFDLETINNLQLNFYNHHVARPLNHKNLNVPSDITNQDDLFSWVTQNNAGFMMGDMHSQIEEQEMIKQKASELAANGYDTIYIESPAKFFEQVMSLTPDEMDILARDKEYNGIKIPEKYEVGTSLINKDSMESSWSSKVGMFAELLRNGIEVKNIDERIGPKGLVTSPLRIPVTNFEWLHNIVEDRQGKEGKFGVFAGLAHGAITTNGRFAGLIDDALGVPHMAFNRSDTEDKAFHRGNQYEGVDFWLHGGPDHKVDGYFPLNIENGKASSKEFSISSKELLSAKIPTELPDLDEISRSK